MKQYIYLKPSPSIQLGHLYEHVFCMQLNALLRSKGLYSFLDYAITGKTYHGGMVYLQIDLYTKRRINIKKLVAKMAIKFDQATVSLGISQIIAEKGVMLGGNGYDKIITELEQLHKQSWVAIDDFDILDAKNIRRKSYPIYTTDQPVSNTKKLKLSINLNTNRDRNMIPLFRQISHLILLNIENAVCDKFGYFACDNSFISDKHSTKLTHIFNVGAAHIEPQAIANTALEIIQSMVKDRALVRFGSQLRSMSYAKKPLEATDFEKNYEDTLVFIGAKGWKSSASPDNISKVLNASSFELIYGKQNANTALIDVLG